jgi:two-component system, NtrC family, sensor histidine kinase PilS
MISSGGGPATFRTKRTSGEGGPGRVIPPTHAPDSLHVLRWVYMGRVALATGVLLGALVTWGEADPRETFIVTLLFLSVLSVTGLGVYHTRGIEGRPSTTFLYTQMAFDALAITTLVHITGGFSSLFASLYIPLIGVTAVVLPFPGVALIGGISAILYVSEAFWAQDVGAFSSPVLLQVGLFGAVAVIAGVLGDRLRQTGTQLGAVESELRRLRLDTSEILASVTSGILTVDAEERLVYLNPAGEALLDLDAGSWEGRPVLDAVGEVAPELRAILVDSLADGVSRYRRTAEVDRRGEVIVLGVASTVRDAEGELRTVTAIFQDITDQERLAELNRRNERLEAVAELSASMAHEIRNPMASIRSAVEQFQSPRLSQDDRVALTAMVVRESDRLSRLLSDFIDFARVRVAQDEAVDVALLLAEAVAVVRQHPDAEDRRVKVELRVPEVPVFLSVDPDVLHRAILNLALNAAQFSPEGGSVLVVLDDPHSSGSGGGGREGRRRGEESRMGVADPISIRVRDQGPGIPDEDLDRVFDPFFTTRKEGSGLGLAMVHRAAEAHHGAIVVERPPEGGTEFILYLPGERKAARVLEAENV